MPESVTSAGSRCHFLLPKNTEMLDAIFQRFVAESPISVMVRALMESVLAPDKIDGKIETEKTV